MQTEDPADPGTGFWILVSGEMQLVSRTHFFVYLSWDNTSDPDAIMSSLGVRVQSSTWNMSDLGSLYFFCVLAVAILRQVLANKTLARRCFSGPRRWSKTVCTSSLGTYSCSVRNMALGSRWFRTLKAHEGQLMYLGAYIRLYLNVLFMNVQLPFASLTQHLFLYIIYI